MTWPISFSTPNSCLLRMTIRLPLRPSPVCRGIRRKPNKHKRFLLVSIRWHPALIFCPKVLCIFVKTFRIAPVLYVSNICFCVRFSFNSISVSFGLIYMTTAKTISSFSLKWYVSGSRSISFPEVAILSVISFIVVFQYIMTRKKDSHIFPLFF